MVLVSLVEVNRPTRGCCAPDADRHGVDRLLKLLLAPLEPLDEFSQRAFALAQCEYRQLVLAGYGGHHEGRKGREGPEEVLHYLLLHLRPRVTVPIGRA